MKKKKTRRQQMRFQRMTGLALILSSAAWLSFSYTAQFDATWVVLMAPLGLLLLLCPKQILF